MRSILSVVVLLAFAASATAQTANPFERALLNARALDDPMVVKLGVEPCAPIWLHTELHGDDANLSQDSIETAVRSRLRAARLYEDDPEWVVGILRVNVSTYKAAFSVQIWFEKEQIDKMTGVEGWSRAGWDDSVLGIYNDKPRVIMAAINEGIDIFLDDFLRVNEAVCASGN